MTQEAIGWQNVNISDDGATRASNTKGKKFLSAWLHVILVCGLPEDTGNPDFDFAAAHTADNDFRHLFPKAACDLLDVQGIDHDEWSYPRNDFDLDLIEDKR